MFVLQRHETFELDQIRLGRPHFFFVMKCKYDKLHGRFDAQIFSEKAGSANEKQEKNGMTGILTLKTGITRKNGMSG